VIDKKNQLNALNTRRQVNTSSDGVYRVYHQDIKANMKTDLYIYFILLKAQYKFNPTNKNASKALEKYTRNETRTERRISGHQNFFFKSQTASNPWEIIKRSS